MATAGELLSRGSTAPDGSTAGVNIQNLGAGSLALLYSTMSSDVSELESNASSNTTSELSSELLSSNSQTSFQTNLNSISSEVC